MADRILGDGQILWYEDGGIQYTVVEDPVPENFTQVYSKLSCDEENRNMSIEITNLARTSISAQKKWVGKTEKSASIKLLADGRRVLLLY